jgi:hypothetical protein
MADRSDTGRSDRGFIVALMAILVASLLGNIAFFLKVQQQAFAIEAKDRHIATEANEAGLYKQDSATLLKRADDLKATLAECNAALASVQAKPIPAPVVCPPIPPAPIIAPEPQACPPMPVCPTPEPIPAPTPATPAAPEPPRIVQHYYFHPHVHRRHHPATTPCCKCEWKSEN